MLAIVGGCGWGVVLGWLALRLGGDLRLSWRRGILGGVWLIAGVAAALMLGLSPLGTIALGAAVGVAIRATALAWLSSPRGAST